MPVPKILAQNLRIRDAVYDSVNNRILYAEDISAPNDDSRSRICALRLTDGVTQVLGTGYELIDCMALSADGKRLYLTQRSEGQLLVPRGEGEGVGFDTVTLFPATRDFNSSLLRLDPSRAARTNATTLLECRGVVTQLALAETYRHAFLLEAGVGLIKRVAIPGQHTTAAEVAATSTKLEMRAFVVSADESTLYVANRDAREGVDRITRVDLASGRCFTVITGLPTVGALAFTDESETALLFLQPTGPSRLMRLDLLTGTAQAVCDFGAERLKGILKVGMGRWVVTTADKILELDFRSSMFASPGQLLLGIGKVPFDRISNGTASISGSAFEGVDFKDAPFGGTLRVLFDHDAARALGASYYSLEVDGVEPKQAFSITLFRDDPPRSESKSLSPQQGHFYPVRASSEKWIDPLLGYRLDTTVLANGLHTLKLRLYRDRSLSSEITFGQAEDGRRAITILVDNQRPQAILSKIVQVGVGETGPCGCAHTGPRAEDGSGPPNGKFQFQISAADAENHLLSWTLVAEWGDDRSAVVDHGNTPVVGGLVPAAQAWNAWVNGDPTSVECAHNFVLTVCDRTINGDHYIHSTRVHRTIAIMP